MTVERGTAGEVLWRVRNFIRASFLSAADAGSLRDDSSLLEEGIMDSTGVMDLVMFIEDTFGIEVRDEELVPDNLDSVDRIVAFVQRKTVRAGQ